ncbi:MAG: hypothetical protein Q8J94_00410 [Thiobacillus sp.]|nr:hypothetical protein [Thiobacillus sp.]
MIELIMIYGGFSLFVLGCIAYALYAFRQYDRLHDRNSIVIEVERSKNLKELASKLGVSETQAVHVAVKRLHHELFQ